MALTPRSGFSNTQQSVNTVPTEIPNTQSDILATMPFISNTALNEYAIDTGQYPNTTAMIAGFGKGHRVSVTYYRIINKNGSNVRTNIADYSATRSIVDSEYQKILNLEITLPSAFVFAPDPASASVSISGQAMLYPNMNPNIGDVFLIGTGDGRTGLARLSAVTPMSWRTNRSYAVEFIIQSFADTSDIAALEQSTTSIMVFDKVNYLGGSAALLSEQNYLNLKTIKAMRSNLCRYFHQTFYDTNLCSYIKPDGTYDAYLVQFMSNKLTFDEIPIRPKNLLGKNPSIYNTTIWSRLEDRYNPTLYGISQYQSLIGYSETLMGVFVTELVGYWIVVPTTESDNLNYIFTTNFWTGAVTLMTPMELLIYTAITQRNCGDLGTLLNNFLLPVFTLDITDQFYNIPLFIHLIDMALQNGYREIDSSSMDYTSGGYSADFISINSQGT